MAWQRAEHKAQFPRARARATRFPARACPRVTSPVAVLVLLWRHGAPVGNSFVDLLPALSHRGATSAKCVRCFRPAGESAGEYGAAGWGPSTPGQLATCKPSSIAGLRSGPEDMAAAIAPKLGRMRALTGPIRSNINSTILRFPADTGIA